MNARRLIKYVILLKGCTVQIDFEKGYIQPVSKGQEGVWLCLAAHCSQDAFNFLTVCLALPKNGSYWQE